MMSFHEWLKNRMPGSLDSSGATLAESDTVKAGKFEWIINEPDTADESSPIGGSWKAYWRHNGDPDANAENLMKWPKECSVAGCTRDAEHGAHVRDENGKVFIVPMCAKDNNPHNKKDMRLNKSAIMVEAPK